MKLIELLQKFIKFKGLKLIIGDFNFPNIDWDNLITNRNNKSLEQKFLNFVNDNFLNQLILKPARFRSCYKNNILDLVLVNENSLIRDLTMNAPIGKSDHIVINFEIDVSVSIRKSTTVKLNFDKGDYKRMNDYIVDNLYIEVENIKNNEPLDQHVIDKLSDHFINVLSKAINKFIPTKKFCITKGRVKFSSELKELIKRKKSVWQKYFKTKNEKTLLVLMNIKIFGT